MKDFFFYIIFFLVFVFFINVYVDYKPNSKFSIFIVRKVEAIKHIIFYNKEEREKKIKKLEVVVEANNKKFSQLKKKWKEETDKLDDLQEKEEDLKAEFKDYSTSLDDKLAQATEICGYFKRRVPKLNNCNEKIKFFETELVKIKNNFGDEDKKLKRELDDSKREQEDIEEDIDRLNSLLRSTENEDLIEEYKEKLKLKENERYEIADKIKDIEDNIETNSDKYKRIDDFKDIITSMKDVFEKSEKKKSELKKISQNIKNRKKNINDLESDLKELGDIISRDKDYIQELRG